MERMMKHIPFYLGMTVMVAISLCLVACDKLSDDGKNNLSDHLSLKVTNCERVGSRLLIEFDLINKSGKDITNMSLSQGDTYDDAGNKYTGYLRVAGGGEGRTVGYTISLNKDETKKMELILADFDKSGDARKVNFIIRGNPKEVGTLDDNKLSTSTSIAPDTRVRANGIQTSDKKLSFSVVSCKRIGTELVLTFTMTNNTSIALQKVKYGALYDNGYSDTGQELTHFYMAFEGGERITDKFDMNPSETKTLELHHKDFDPSGTANNVSFDITLACGNYVFTDSQVHFLTVNVEK